MSNQPKVSESTTVQGETRTVIGVRQQKRDGKDQIVVSYFARIGGQHLNSSKSCTLDEWQAWTESENQR